MAEQISDLEAKVGRQEKKRVKGELALDDQEQRGRRWNVRIPKVPVLPDETNASLKTQLVQILSDAGTQIGLQDVVRWHRSSKTAPSMSPRIPKSTDSAFLRWIAGTCESRCTLPERRPTRTGTGSGRT